MGFWSSVGSHFNNISTSNEKTELKNDEIPGFDRYMNDLRNATPEKFLGMKKVNQLEISEEISVNSVDVFKVLEQKLTSDRSVDSLSKVKLFVELEKAKQQWQQMNNKSN